MSTYIPEWRISEYEDRLRGGDREAGEQLVRFYESEISSMAIRRDRALRELALLDRGEPLYVEAETVDSFAIEATTG